MATSFSNILSVSATDEHDIPSISSRLPLHTRITMRFGSLSGHLGSSTLVHRLRQWTAHKKSSIQLCLIFLLMVMVVVFSSAILISLSSLKTDFSLSQAKTTSTDPDNLPYEERHAYRVHYLCDGEQTKDKKIELPSSFTWINCSESQNECKNSKNALQVNGDTVCHGMIEGQLSIGRFVGEGDGSCLVPYGGSERALFTPWFEILTAELNSYKWTSTRDGVRVDMALPAGMIRGGEIMYIGQCQYMGSLVVGKVASSHGCLYIGYQGSEVCCREYEVLVALKSGDFTAALSQLQRFCPS